MILTATLREVAPLPTQPASQLNTLLSLPKETLGTSPIRYDVAVSVVIPCRSPQLIPASRRTPIFVLLHK